MTTGLYRSRLVIPINESKYIEKAHQRNADLYVLDMEDSVPLSEKNHARKLVKESVETMKLNRLIVYIRVNNDKNLYDDLSSVIDSDADGILIPKVENPEEILEIESFLRKQMDKERFSAFKISILIESVKGYMALEEILSCSDKIDTASYGMEDLTKEIGFQYISENEKYLDYLRLKLIMLCKLHGIQPLGLIGSITNYTDIEGFKQSAKQAYSIGYEGSSCIHPNQVAVLNDFFKPSEEVLQEMNELVSVFEDAIRKGRASTTFQGKMIDYPHYESAKKILGNFNFSKGSESHE
ncbi:CoA ester lyase [Sporosarcina sp. BI001-red]|uniref:HpcH/HpaI aldolase/citrate lyase family protein n=1 Tax=Sporosarcina sp. BI001-red TaxID=2282866 RepID=UPI000E263429|nr:CoA ester lyase [Sporosarcina sp. BI001-red]REB08753.1 CoA ester lyase [Sporosarcina sp. BI001-red]